MLRNLREVGITAKLHFLSYASLLKEQRSGRVTIAFQTRGSYSVNDISAFTSVFFKGGIDDHAQDEEAYWAPILIYSSNYAFTKDLNFTPYSDELPRFIEASWK